MVDEHLIWGATARIIENLLDRLERTGLDGERPRPSAHARTAASGRVAR